MRLTSCLLGLLLLCAPSYAGITINANSTANNGGSPGWGMFFDLQSTGQNWILTQMSTASTAAAGGSFTIDFYTRSGTALGGPVGSGPGSSSAGWNLVGTASVTQGPTSSGISNLFNTPNIPITSSVTGVAMIFAGAGPRYLGTGTPPLQVFSDANVSLTTGDARSAPFTTGGSFFTSRGLSGSIVYDIVPEPTALSFVGLAAVGLLRRR